MQYAVVKFIDECDDGEPLVQEVPVNWLTSNKQECWWPPSNVTKHIKTASQPQSSWKMFRIDLKNIYGK